MRCKIIPAAAGIKRPSIQTWKDSSHRINRIHMPIRGKLLYNDINGVRVLNEGSLYLMTNSCSQNFEMVPDCGYYHLFIDFQTVPPLLHQEVLEVDFTEDLYLYYLVKAVESVIREAGGSDAMDGRYEVRRKDPEMDLVGPLLELIVKHFQVRYNLRIIEHPKLESAIRFIEEHYSEKLCNEDIARVLHIDPRYLIRLFGKHLEMSPYLYLTQCRIEHALIFLREGKSVSETAFLCGYQSENAFRISFKKMMGASPTQIMKKM